MESSAPSSEAAVGFRKKDAGTITRYESTRRDGMGEKPMNAVYYWILDLNLIGKEEDYVPYLYDKKKGWVVDKDHLLSDRIIGYDGDQIGSIDMLDRVREISREAAEQLIHKMLRVLEKAMDYDEFDP